MSTIWKKVRRNQAALQSHLQPVTYTSRRLAFYSVREFLDASLLLSAKSARFSFVAAFLACRSIELGLKAYLLARGDTLEDVKEIQHDLNKGLTESFARGIDVVVQLTSDERDLILSVNNDYMGHNFAYFDLQSAVVAPKNPDLHLLPTIARKLLNGVERGCFEASDGKWNPF